MGVYNTDQRRTALQVCFLSLDWTPRLVRGPEMQQEPWMNQLVVTCSGGINISSSSGWNQFRYRCLLRCKNRCTVLTCTRAARGINTSAADEPNQFMDPSLPKINVWIFPILQCQHHWFWATGVGPVLIVGHNFLSKRHPAFVSFMLDMNGACAVLWSILKCKYKCIA